MSSQIETLIQFFEGELGTKESPANSNIVKYNDWYYGRRVSGSAYAWCAVFISYGFAHTGLAHLFYGGKRCAGCTTLMNFAKSKKQFHTSGFRRGDLALFNWQGKKDIAQHIGIITEVQSNKVLTIEGNTAVGNDSNGGEVMRRSRSFDTIIGVCRPEYEEDEDVTQEQFEAMYKVMTDKLAKQGVNPNLAPGEYVKAVEAGITDGTRPQAFATRQEVAVMVYRGSSR